MSKNLVPRSFWNFPSINFPVSWEGDENWMEALNSSGLSIYEDDTHVHVEAAVPGLSAEEIEVTFEKGILWIKAEKQEEEEDKKRKYHRKSVSNYSYRVAIPGQLDAHSDPEASYQNGIMKISFLKAKQAQPKKIVVRSGK